LYRYNSQISSYNSSLDLLLKVHGSNLELVSVCLLYLLVDSCWSAGVGNCMTRLSAQMKLGLHGRQTLHIVTRSQCSDL
jgi:hypothetical protein